MSRILILGAGIMQGPAIRCAREMGIETVAVDGDPNAPLAGLADRFENIDLKDHRAIEACARKLAVSGGLDGVMTCGTDFSSSVAWVAEKLELPGIPYEAALDASDKERMRRRFQEHGLPSPAFIVCTAPPETLPFAFPAVVKPVDNMGARGCRRVDTMEETREAAAAALAFSRSGRAIIEEYMEGPEFSVDAVVFDGEITICGLADRHIYFPPYFIEMGHTMPTRFSRADQEALLDVFTRGIRALGITSGAAKGDIKLTSKGPMIGEIAARLSGGYMSGWTYPYASGVEPVRGAIAAALGQKPEGLAPLRNWTSAERAFISIPGLALALYGLEKARAIPWVKDIFPRAGAGSRLRFPENNVTKAGNVIAAAPSREEAVRAAEEAARCVLIRLAAPDGETDAFLAADGADSSAFPPPAFSIPPELRKALCSLPLETGKALPPTGPLRLYPFPAFTASGLSDYLGRSVAESLEAVHVLTGRTLETGTDTPALGRGFWSALIRGGYQGGAYYIDRRSGEGRA